MAKTVRAVFDGEVLRLEQPVDLQPNTTYVITIEHEVRVQEEGVEDAYPLTEISRLASDLGVTDFSIRHRRYAQGRVGD